MSVCPRVVPAARRLRVPRVADVGLPVALLLFRLLELLQLLARLLQAQVQLVAGTE